MPSIIVPRRHLVQPQGYAEINPYWWRQGSVIASPGLPLPAGTMTGTITKGVIASGVSYEFGGFAYLTVSTAVPPPCTLIAVGTATTATTRYCIGGSGPIGAAERTQFDFYSGTPRSILVNTGGAAAVATGPAFADGAPFVAVFTVSAAGSPAVYAKGTRTSVAAPGGAFGTYTGTTIGAMRHLNAEPYTRGLSLYALLPVEVSQTEAFDLLNNPWQLFRASPRRLYFDVPSSSPVPTLSAATAINVTSSSFEPRVSYAF